jgi:hypothetical protein
VDRLEWCLVCDTVFVEILNIRVEMGKRVKKTGFWAKIASLLVAGKNWGLTEGDLELE